MNLVFLTLEFDEAAIGECAPRATGIAYGGRDQYPGTPAGGALDAAGGVDRVADHGVILTMFRRADEAHHRFAGVDANTDVKLFTIGTPLLAETQQCLFHLARASECAGRMIRLVRRRAPERHDGIADVFVQRSLMTEDHFDLQAEIAVEQIHDLLRRF